MFFSAGTYTCRIIHTPLCRKSSVVGCFKTHIGRSSSSSSSCLQSNTCAHDMAVVMYYSKRTTKSNCASTSLQRLDSRTWEENSSYGSHPVGLSKNLPTAPTATVRSRHIERAIEVKLLQQPTLGVPCADIRQAAYRQESKRGGGNSSSSLSPFVPVYLSSHLLRPPFPLTTHSIAKTSDTAAVLLRCLFIQTPCLRARFLPKWLSSLAAGRAPTRRSVYLSSFSLSRYSLTCCRCRYARAELAASVMDRFVV